MEPKEALALLAQVALEGAAGGEVYRVYEATEALSRALSRLASLERAHESLEARHRALEARLRELEAAQSRALLALMEAADLLRGRKA